MSEHKPLFVPLKSEFYDAFVSWQKIWEYRKYGPRWNEKTCFIGRRVVLSKGYGKQNRSMGTIRGFETKRQTSKEWIACYGEPGEAACILIELDKT